MLRFIDIDVTKPDFQSLKAAAELLEQDYPVVFPSDTTYGILMRFTAENAARLHTIRRENTDKPFLVVISEDFDWQQLVKADGLPQENLGAVNDYWPGPVTLVFTKAVSLSYPPADSIAIRMPSAENNRAFHTLVQLCDFPIMAPSFNLPGEPVILDQKTGADRNTSQRREIHCGFQPRAPHAPLRRRG